MNYFDIQLRRIRDAARSIATREPFDVLLVSHHPEYFDASEFTNFHEGAIKSLTFIPDFQQLTVISKTFDIAIVCSNVIMPDQQAMFRIREKNLAGFVFVWTFDNHHDRAANLIVNALADVVVPSHKFNVNFMRTPCTLLGSHVPLGTNQWSRDRARNLFASSSRLERKDGLHGSFVDWDFVGKVAQRQNLARECQAKLPGNAIKLIGSNERQSYFGLSPEQRWYDWASHKTELVLPLECDLSFRVFDSLLTGQIPIVPTWCYDLDGVVSPELQNSLPIIRFNTPTADAIEAAWREALQRFDVDESDGALRRHVYALNNHHIVNRIQAICNQVKVVAQAKDIHCTIDREGVGFVL
jgi:hypothetical protein